MHTCLSRILHAGLWHSSTPPSRASVDALLAAGGCCAPPARCWPGCRTPCTHRIGMLHHRHSCRRAVAENNGRVLAHGNRLLARRLLDRPLHHLRSLSLLHTAGTRAQLAVCVQLAVCSLYEDSTRSLRLTRLHTRLHCRRLPCACITTSESGAKKAPSGPGTRKNPTAPYTQTFSGALFRATRRPSQVNDF